MQLRYYDGSITANYHYDAWGKLLSVTNADDTAITYTNSVAYLNPIRYRGYVYDNETGFYYLNSRYYDPSLRRFINPDGCASTGQGFSGNNIFTYCGNNPVMYSDSSGQFFVSALIFGAVLCGVALILSGCSAKSKSEPEPYKSADEAAKAFSESVYSSSRYIRHEYATVIYSRTINGETTYNYNTPRSGTPHSADVGAPTPSGTEMVAYAHTHPNSNSFFLCRYHSSC